MKKALWIILIFSIISIRLFSLQAMASTTFGEYLARTTYDEGELFEADDYTYVLSDGKAVIVSYNGTYTQVEIPETLGGYTVAGIDDYAFEECLYENGVEIRSIILPRSIEEISEFALSSLIYLERIDISDENQCFCVIDNVLFSKDKTMLIKYPSQKQGHRYSIPNSVKVIYAVAFEDNKYLTEVTIPEGVTDIKSYAFSGTAIEQADIPASVKSIGCASFSNCFYLSQFNVNVNNMDYTSADGVLYTKDKCSLIQYPIASPNTSFVVKEGVSKICERAFCSCTLSAIVLPDSLSLVDYAAFYNCNFLKSILYYGQHADWKKVVIEPNNSSLENENLIYNYDKRLFVDAYISDCYCQSGKAVANIKYNYIFDDCTAYFAIYNEDGSLACMASKDVLKTDTDTAFEINVNSDLKGREAKVFFWSCDNAIKPAGRAICAIVGDPVLESDHPYKNKTDEIKVYTYSGECTSIDVTFTDDTETESGWDYIYIYDEKDNQIGEYTGRELSGQTINVPGKAVKIRLTSDNSETMYGYKTSGIVVNK